MSYWRCCATSSCIAVVFVLSHAKYLVVSRSQDSGTQHFSSEFFFQNSNDDILSVLSVQWSQSEDYCSAVAGGKSYPKIRPSSEGEFRSPRTGSWWIVASCAMINKIPFLLPGQDAVPLPQESMTLLYLQAERPLFFPVPCLIQKKKRWNSCWKGFDRAVLYQRCKKEKNPAWIFSFKKWQEAAVGSGE